MESYTLTVRGRDRGSLSQNRTTVLSNGPILTIKCDAPTKSHGPKPSFVRISIDRTGSRIAAGDSQGNIYIFDQQKDKYWFLHHLDRSCSSISFTACKENDLIIASSSTCAVHFFHAESCTIRETSHLHKTCVNHIVANTDGLQVITSSLEVAIIWDITNFAVLNKIRSSTDFEIIKVFFIPIFSNVAAAFKDGKVAIYKFQSHQLVCEFSCRDESSRPYWLQTIDISNDGKLIACAGKKDKIAIWNMETKSFMCSVSLPSYFKSVKQVQFLSSVATSKQCVLSILGHCGKLGLYDIQKSIMLYKMDNAVGKIMSYMEGNMKIVIITGSAELQLFDLSGPLTKRDPVKKKCAEKTKAQQTYKDCPKRICRDGKKPVPVPPKLDEDRIKEFLLFCGEYPAEYRQWIWSFLLKLPQNKDFSAFYNQDNINLKLETGIEKPWIHQASLKIHSMLVQWCPVLKEVDYIPGMMRPFVIAFHRNLQMCFELIVTYIANWCQNWFWYLPLLPINILYAIENLLLYHDRELLHHFLIHDISSEVYGFSLLKSSFSNVFKEEEWFKLWDHIFSEPPDFLIFVLIAFNTVSRKVLMRCSSKDDVVSYFHRWSLLASTVLGEAHHLRTRTPPTFNPLPIVGSFTALESEGYFVFNKFAFVQCDFPMLTKQELLDDEVESLLNRKDEILSSYNSEESCGVENQWSAIQKENLLELKKVHDLINRFVLQSAQEKHVAHLSELEDKVKRLQKLMQRNLTYQPTPKPVKNESLRSKTTYVPKSDHMKTIKSILEQRKNLAEKH